MIAYMHSMTGAVPKEASERSLQHTLCTFAWLRCERVLRLIIKPLGRSWGPCEKKHVRLLFLV